eukprot:Opistho-1_new@21578
MKVTVKTLQQTSFPLEVDPSETVASVKEKIFAAKGSEYAVANQKLIYAGAILLDSNPLSQYNVKENDFIVVMVTKPKAPAAAAASAPAPAPATPAKEEPKPAAVTPAPSQPPATPAAPAPAATAAAPAATPAAAPTPLGYSSAASALVTGADYERMVSQLMEMGFGREEVVRALRAAFNNPDRAVDYLMNGIPAFADAAPAAPGGGAGAPPAPAEGEEGGEEEEMDEEDLANLMAAGGGGGDALDFLRNQPQFQQLREVVRANPQLLQPLLQQLGQANPELLQLINANQQAFLNLLSEPAGGPRGGAGARQPGQLPPGSISVTQEEREAIERLEGLGFDRRLVIEAYFACDKNEQLAANYLFDHGNDDDQNMQ